MPWLEKRKERARTLRNASSGRSPIPLKEGGQIPTRLTRMYVRMCRCM